MLEGCVVIAKHRVDQIGFSEEKKKVRHFLFGSKYLFQGTVCGQNIITIIQDLLVLPCSTTPTRAGKILIH